MDNYNIIIILYCGRVRGRARGSHKDNIMRPSSHALARRTAAGGDGLSSSDGNISFKYITGMILYTI